MQQMPEEGRLFAAVDKSYRDIMRATALDTHVMKASSLNFFMTTAYYTQRDDV